jgi:AraC-like DNA-binding protein
MPLSLPPRTDLFAFLIFLGMVQGVVLGYFFLKHSRGSQAPNRYLGGLMLGMTLLMTDVWLCYTNYMFRVVWLDDSTEWVNLLIAPLVYLYFRESLGEKPLRRAWLHALPSALYFLYLCVLWFPQPVAVRYSAYISAFHRELPQPPVEAFAKAYGPAWAFWPKDAIIELTALSMVGYFVLSVWQVRNAFQRAGIPFFSPKPVALTWYRNLMLQIGSVVGVFAVCRLTFPDDLGDHLIAAHMALVIYATSFALLRQSAYFTPKPPEPEAAKKYGKSALTPELEEHTLRKLSDVMAAEKPFLDPTCSLPNLAGRLGVSPHHLSQVLNDRMNQNFFEFLATYRIGEAKRLLSDPALAHLKLEEIGERVGYASKSAFNGAFKKLTGQTPSEFRRSRVSAGTPGR